MRNCSNSIRDQPHTSFKGTHSSLPSIGASPLICVPSAARTCWEVSETKSSILVIISLSSVSLSMSLQKPASLSTYLRVSQHYKPGIWPVIAVRTSASLSFRSLTNAGTRSLVRVSSSTTSAIFGVLSNVFRIDHAQCLPFQICPPPCILHANSYLRRDSLVL